MTSSLSCSEIVQPDFDVVVVGAGLVGAAQGLALRQAGFKVLNIDSGTPFSNSGSSVRRDVRGLALAPSSQMLLKRLALWDELKPRVTPIEHIHVSDQGRFGFTRLNAADIGLDALANVCPADYLLENLQTALDAQS